MSEEDAVAAVWGGGAGRPVRVLRHGPRWGTMAVQTMLVAGGKTREGQILDIFERQR